MKNSFNLSDADGLGHAAVVRCGLCVVKRYYRPEDLMKLFGDIPCMDVESRMRCESCGRKDYLRVRIETLMAEEMAKAQFRRLKGIKLLKRPIWEDERPLR